MLGEDDYRSLAQLLRNQRTASLGTTHDGAPLVSLVAFAVAPDFSAAYLHLSGLAWHTQDLLADPRCALMFSEPDVRSGNPLTLARLFLLGSALPLEPDSPEYSSARTAYVQRLPFTQFNFTLGDFHLFRFEPHAGRYIGGFARAHNLTPDDLRRAAALAT